MGRVFSGVQPTGNLHLGNYLGAIKNFVSLQNDHECIYCVVDMHAITVKQDPKILKSNILEVAAAFVASGINPDKSVIFVQSQVSAHAELAWVFNCVARLGWLNRMTQFKEKAGKNRENASAGLYTYPVLMAADILAYHATHVPVGDDQRQHLELARDIAQKFNNDFQVEYFPITEPVIMGNATRVMSLRDGKNKMSKSDISDYSRLNLTDSADDISNKIRKAKTDPLPLPDLSCLDNEEKFNEDIIINRPEAVNLLNIYSALSNEDTKTVVSKFSEKQFSFFKNELNQLSVETLSPITKEMRKLLDDKSYLEEILNKGGDKANIIAEPILKEAKKIIGFY
jgi:tryptophanyl-tRNA synthetase